MVELVVLVFIVTIVQIGVVLLRVIGKGAETFEVNKKETGEARFKGEN